ncbi:MAG: AMP-binding protein [Rikenellaceae bacterium]|nr:AMP-binding protein [Rikenellaceae bacterium]
MNKFPDIQFRSPEEIREFQNGKLREAVNYLYGHSPYYRRMFRDRGIKPGSIKTVEDLRILPTTSKEDIQLHGEDFICVPRERIVDYVTTSGTLGSPVTFALTSGDLDRLAYNEALSYSTAGCTPGQVMQLMTTIDRRFMAGLAYFMGAREGGYGVVRVGNGIPELQWDTIARIRPDFCIVVPSFLMKLTDFAITHGIDYRSCSLKKAICIGETLRNDDLSLSTLGRRIRERWPELALHSTYASTEMQTSFTECGEFCGGHLQPELIIAELLDQDGKPVAEGESGEVTVTTIGVEGMPLLRFRTGDICRMYNQPCACGRRTPRLGGVIGRKGEMIKYKGTTLYPPAIYDVLNDVPEIITYVVEVFTGNLGTDQLRIKIASRNTDEGFVKHLKDIFRSRIRVAPEIVFATEKELLEIQHSPMERKSRKCVYL